MHNKYMEIYTISALETALNWVLVAPLRYQSMCLLASPEAAATRGVEIATITLVNPRLMLPFPSADISHPLVEGSNRF